MQLAAGALMVAGPSATRALSVTARVRDEFGPLRQAIVHDGSNAIDVSSKEILAKIKPKVLRAHPETGPVDRGRVIEQMGRWRELLASVGAHLIEPEAVPGAYCQVFTRDPCFVVDETLLLASLRDKHRRSEVRGLARLAGDLPSPVVNLQRRWTLIEGGDVMVLDGGELILVGTHRHTNAAGVNALAESIDPEASGRQVIRVPHRALHLDCCVAPLPSGGALINPLKLPDSSIAKLEELLGRLQPIDPHESARHLAANLLWLDERTVASNVMAKKTNAHLRSLGYDVRPVEISQLVHMWGSLRCVTCPVERSPSAIAPG